MSDVETATSSQVVCAFRKVVKKRAPVRRRVEESEGSENEDAEVSKEVMRKKRRQNPMIQSTKRDSARKEGRMSSSDESSGEPTTIVEHAFSASGSVAPLGPKDQGATATLDIDTEVGKDAQSQFERVQQQLDEGLEKDGKMLYKGSAMYGAKKAKDTARGNASSGMNRVGPVRAPQFLRQTVRWDFAPDICKDYKETGFCTFGDSCKFMHDRGDYKHGWEIERDWSAGRTQQKDDENYEIASDEDDLPEECQICENPFKDPVVTKCKHYFCEACAIQAFRKSKRCRVCNENTGGVFNIAKDIVAKMAGEPSKKKKKSDSEDNSEEDEEKEEEDTEMQLLPEEDAEDDAQEEEANGEDQGHSSGNESEDGAAIGNEV